MRKLILSCFVALATAAPEGYNYAAQQSLAPQPHQHYKSASTASFFKDLQTVMAVQSANIESSLGGAKQLFSSVNKNSNDIVQYSSGQGVTAPAQVAQSTQQQQQQPKTLITKRFYIHAAPEDDEEEVKQQFVSIGKPRKNYNVVFIKAPTKAAQKTSLKIRPAVNEERTVIYVLDKKQDASEIEAQIHEPATTTTKPEVYFIRYRTPEEAAHAQQTIQAQYDALGGSTQVTNENTAVVSSVIGSLDAAKQATEAQASETQTQTQIPENEAQQVAAAISAQQQQQQESVAVAEAQSVQLSLSEGANKNGYLP